ncbi:MAG: hypothetical protein K5655_00535 [Lachnospiraceae bacterium]|nr:hypothetical protein [Lachnospiraceae bacterium]
MTDKARDRAGKRTKKNMTPFWVTFCTFLVLAAVVAGFLYAGDLIKENETDKEPETDIGQTTGKTDIEADDSELIFAVNRDLGTIDFLILCRLDSRKNRLRLSLIEPEMSYTMSASLYSELSTLNVRLPQNGRFGGLTGYCTEGTFDTGRKIAAEMLAVDVKHYSSFDSKVIDELITVSGNAGERVLSLDVYPSQAKSAMYGTPGTMLGFVKKLFTDTVESDRTTDDRLIYLEAFDALGDSDVITETVPVKKHNESTELDVSEWRRQQKH